MKHLHTFNVNWETQTLDKKKEHQKYHLKDGTLVPGVTTVLNVLNKDALINWAAKVERESILNWTNGLQTLPEKLFYTTIRDTAADVGSVAHFMAECFINEKNPQFIDYDNTIIERGELSFNKFRDYWEESGYRLVKSEAQLVSEVHRYGGTLDSVVTNKQGHLILMDLKTSKAVYTDYFTQVAAYKRLWQENHDAKINKSLIFRIGKEDPDDQEIVEIHPTLLEAHWDRFQAALAVYKTTKQTELIQKQLAA